MIKPSFSFPDAASRKSLKNPEYALKRLNLLLLRILTRIEFINIFLAKEKIDDKDLKFKISLLSLLLEVKKKLRIELKELAGEKPAEDLGDILN